MATWNAIAATTAAIVGLLDDAYPREFGTLSVVPAHASDLAGEKPIQDGFTVCLYRVGLNGTLRNLPPRTSPEGLRYRSSLPLDLQYLITPWAGNVQKQQQLLGWCLRHLEDNPVLPPGLLNQYLKARDVFRPEESVELIFESMSLPDFANIWDKFKPRLQTSALYIARMVLIDSDVRQHEGPPVQTRVFDMAKVTP